MPNFNKLFYRGSPMVVTYSCCRSVCTVLKLFLQYSLNKLQSYVPKNNPVAPSVFKHQAAYHEDILSPFLCLSISRCSTKERYSTSPSPSTSHSWLPSPSSPLQIPLSHHLLMHQLRIRLLWVSHPHPHVHMVWTSFQRTHLHSPPLISCSTNLLILPKLILFLLLSQIFLHQLQLTNKFF